MDYNDTGFITLAYWISNVVGLAFLVVALQWPRVARLMFALLFGYAALVNYNLSHANPAAYLDYAEHAVGFYPAFIKGWFSDHITVFVSFIALGQFLTALGMVLRKSFVTLACVGVIIFLTAIAPLGLYAAFPFSVTVSVAAWLIIKRDSKEYLWIRSAAFPDKRRFESSIE